MQTATIDDIRRSMAEVLDIPEARVVPDAVLTDLVTDSFRLVELAIELQDRYAVMFGQEHMRGISTVGDLAALVHSRLA